MSQVRTALSRGCTFHTACVNKWKAKNGLPVVRSGATNIRAASFASASTGDAESQQSLALLSVSNGQATGSGGSTAVAPGGAATGNADAVILPPAIPVVASQEEPEVEAPAGAAGTEGNASATAAVQEAPKRNFYGNSLGTLQGAQEGNST